MPGHEFSLVGLLQYKDKILDSVHIQEYTDQEKPTKLRSKMQTFPY